MRRDVCIALSPLLLDMADHIELGIPFNELSDVHRIAAFQIYVSPWQASTWMDSSPLDAGDIFECGHDDRELTFRDDAWSAITRHSHVIDW